MDSGGTQDVFIGPKLEKNDQVGMGGKGAVKANCRREKKKKGSNDLFFPLFLCPLALGCKMHFYSPDCTVDKYRSGKEEAALFEKKFSLFPKVEKNCCTHISDQKAIRSVFLALLSPRDRH